MNNLNKFVYFDDEEKELIESIEAGIDSGEIEFEPISEKEKHLFVQAAKNTLDKLNAKADKEKFAVPQAEMKQIKTRAKKLGISHKKAISLLIKQFAQGKIDLKV